MSNRDYTNTPKMIIGSESEKKRKPMLQKLKTIMVEKVAGN